MKTKLVTLLFLLCLPFLAVAKEMKSIVFKTIPELHCVNCEKKVKSNLRFVKGVKSITTDLKTNTVTVKYDAEKATLPMLIEGFSKIGYKVQVVKPKAEEKK